MSRQINSPQVVAYFGLAVVCGIVLLIFTVETIYRIDRALQRRRDNQIFKAVKEARRDFR